MSLLGVAASMGVPEPDLEELLRRGYVTSRVASRVGTSQDSVRDFIAGHVGERMALALGATTSAAQDLRDAIDRQGAIGVIIGLCIGKPHTSSATAARSR